MAHSCKLANLVLASLTKHTHFVLRIDKSPLYNEPCVTSHMIAGRFHYVYNLFELQDSEGYWFLIKKPGDDQEDDFSPFLWNLFKGALDVVVYEFKEVPYHFLSKAHRKLYDDVSQGGAFGDVSKYWDPKVKIWNINEYNSKKRE